MIESCTIEIYQNEELYRLRPVWHSSNSLPWVVKAAAALDPTVLITSIAPEQVTLPSDDWSWVSNWKIDMKPGLTDEEGWEYASRISRFYNNRANRTPKSSRKRERARRRLWCRVMTRDGGAAHNKSMGPKKLDFKDIKVVLPRIQSGLTSVHAARVQVELATQTADASDCEEVQTLVRTVKQGIRDLQDILNQVEEAAAKQTKQQSSRTTPVFNAAIVKKLRNDVAKEWVAINKALVNFEQKSSMLNSSSSSYGSASSPQSSVAVSALLSAIPENTPERSNTMSSYSRHVKGGTAGAFTPSIQPATDKTVRKGYTGTPTYQGPGAYSGRLDSVDNGDGDFVDRGVHEYLIEQKFVVIDEGAVNSEIIEERAVDIDRINVAIVELHGMFQDLSVVVKEQEAFVDAIVQNVEESHHKTELATGQIAEARKLQRQSQCVVS